jgi:hypothetical protein
MVTGCADSGGAVVVAVMSAPEAATDDAAVGVVSGIAALWPQPMSVISPAVIGATKA